MWEESFRQSTKESFGMGIEEEMNTINFGSISDESVLGSKDESRSGFRGVCG